MIGAAVELTERLKGCHLIDVERREYDWAFKFADTIGLRVQCPWRILVEGRIAFAGSDDGHKFGLPAPVDGVARTTERLGGKSIQKVSIREDSGDLTIFFSDRTELEVLNMSAGYEGWEINAEGLMVIALGGGSLAVYMRPPR